MKLDERANQIYIVAVNEAQMQSHEYVLPEHYLYAAMLFEEGKNIISNCGGNIPYIMRDLADFFSEKVPKGDFLRPAESIGLVNMFEIAAAYTGQSGNDIITLSDILVSIFGLDNSYATYILQKNGVGKFGILKSVLQPRIDQIKAAEQEELTSARRPKELEFLAKFAQNLTKKAREGKLDPLIGREDVLEKTMLVLSRRLKNNPVLIGDAGVGKTAIVEGLAERISKGDAPAALKNGTLFYVDMASVVAGTKYRGDFEERLIQILENISKYKTPIIYFDEIHTIVGAGAVSGGGTDATGILKPYLTKGHIRFIGSTTFEEYKKHFEKDRTLARRFLKINVDEPSFEENVKILEGIKHKYEKFHNVTYSPEIINLICSLSTKYLKDRAMPDKAIDVLDETGARAKMRDETPSYGITKEDVEKCVSDQAHVPQNTVSQSDAARLRSLEANLKDSVFGQDEAIKIISDSIKLARSGLMQTERPTANLLFVGPTGVGKTEIAKRLAKLLDVTLIRYDMSEYQEKHSVARLIGSPPGYVGFEDGGLLTDAIRKTPYAVLLLDEIEKAHPDILNILLQVMDYGFLTDNSGKKADFRNVIIIMTSNAGAREIGKHAVGFERSVMGVDAIDKEVERVFSPEFRGRLDSVVVFNRITPELARRITNKEFDDLVKLLQNQGFSLEIQDRVREYVSSKGLLEKYGAREIIRTVNTEIKKLIVDKVMFGDSEHPDKTTIILDYEENELKIEIN
ncbi:ATP-dependent Clp protease ATP-binding subunit ClpA [Clostridia bacterium]|nr:ATP-dependent Clp protease ATP-binding subunit ClpA [Clostridia bacterium]